MQQFNPGRNGAHVFRDRLFNDTILTAEFILCRTG
jgi:hypothetical protein